MMRTTIIGSLLGLGLMGCAAAASPLKVYILAGQSNMQGHAHVKTFDHIGMDPKTAPLLREMRNADGTDRICEDVWISAVGCSEQENEKKSGNLSSGFGAEARGPKIGPEFTFGIYMQKYVRQPILIIKAAWGGKSLHTDFRPPGAGSYELNDFQKKLYTEKGIDLDQWMVEKNKISGVYYRMMMDHVKGVLKDIKQVCPAYDPQQGYELAGFVWFQGWNDMGDSHTYPNRAKPGGYDDFSRLLAQFIRDVRSDLDAPAMPFVIGVMGVGGAIEKQTPTRYTPIHHNFRLAMAVPAGLPEFKGNVAAVLTENYWDFQLDELRTRGAQVNKKEKELRKNQSLTPDEVRAAVEKFRSGLYTPEELAIMEAGLSNKDFHYLGAAKIIAQIGKAFADALADLDKDTQ